MSVMGHGFSPPSTLFTMRKFLSWSPLHEKLTTPNIEIQGFCVQGLHEFTADLYFDEFLKVFHVSLSCFLKLERNLVVTTKDESMQDANHRKKHSRPRRKLCNRCLSLRVLEMNVPFDRVLDLLLERDIRMAKQVSFRWRSIKLAWDYIYHVMSAP